MAEHIKQEFGEEDELIEINEQGFSIINAAYIIVGQFVGIGILGLPFVYYQMGISTAFIVMMTLVFVKICTVQLYMDIVILAPEKPKTVMTIGYMMVGRSAIFFIPFIIVLNVLLLNSCYLMTLAEMSASMISDWLALPAESFFAKKLLYIFLLAGLQLYYNFKKQMSSYKIIGNVLMAFFAIFVTLLCYMAVNGYNFRTSQSADSKLQKTIKTSTSDPQLSKMILSIQSLMIAFNVMSIFFSTYQNMRKRTPNYFNMSFSLAALLISICYSSVAISGIYIFGDELETQNANLMKNINLMYSVKKTSAIFWISEVLRFVYFWVLFFHMQINFFPAKDHFLMMIDELQRQTTSKQLESKYAKDVNAGVKEPLLAHHQNECSTAENQFQEEPENQGQNSYDDMPQYQYIMATSFIVFLQVILAVSFQMLKQVVPWIAGVGVNFQEMLFPAFFYLCFLKRYQGEKPIQHLSFKIVTVIVNFMLGATLIVFLFVGGSI